MQAGGDTVIQIGSPASSGAQSEGMELSQRNIHALISGLGASFNSASDEGKARRDLTAVESSLSREIDGYRELLRAGFPLRASQCLRTLLDKLPEGATPYTLTHWSPGKEAWQMAAIHSSGAHDSPRLSERR